MAPFAFKSFDAFFYEHHPVFRHFFQEKYNKTYNNAREELQRFSVFEKLNDEIKIHNQKYHKGHETYTKTVYKFHDLTEPELKVYLKGLKIPKDIANKQKHKAGFKRKPRPLPLTTVPAYPLVVDLRPILLPPKDQGLNEFLILMVLIWLPFYSVFNVAIRSIRIHVRKGYGIYDIFADEFE